MEKSFIEKLADSLSEILNLEHVVSDRETTREGIEYIENVFMSKDKDDCFYLRLNDTQEGYPVISIGYEDANVFAFECVEIWDVCSKYRMMRDKGLSYFSEIHEQ